MKRIVLALAISVVCGGSLSAQASPEAEALLSKMRETVGGAGRLAAARTLEFRGTLIPAPGQEPAPITVRVARPNLYWMRIQLPAGEILNLFDGEKAWYRTVLPGDPGVWEPMEPAEGIELRTRAWETANPDGIMDLPGRTVSVDAEGRLVMTYTEGEPRKRVLTDGLPQVEESSDGATRLEAYQEFEGIRFPTKMTTRGPLGDVITQFNEVLINPEFAPEQFVAK